MKQENKQSNRKSIYLTNIFARMEKEKAEGEEKANEIPNAVEAEAEEESNEIPNVVEAEAEEEPNEIPNLVKAEAERRTKRNSECGRSGG